MHILAPLPRIFEERAWRSSRCQGPACRVAMGATFAWMELRAEHPRDHAAALDVHRRAFGAARAQVAGLMETPREGGPGPA